jgi:hypothetical protein
LTNFVIKPRIAPFPRFSFSVFSFFPFLLTLMFLHHIISEQVWQNLVPLLALRPPTVVQYRSAGERWEKAARGLEAAARLAGLHETRFIDRPLASDFPSFAEWREAFEGGLTASSANVFNLTGGTKLASIAAHRLCTERGIPSFYYDSRHPLFDGATGPLPPMRDATGVVASLTVPIALAAHGYDPEGFKADTPSPALLAFGRRATDLFAAGATPINQWLDTCRRQLLPKGNWAEGSKLRALLQAPLPAPPSEAALDYADAAIEAGLLRVDASGRFFPVPDPNAFGGSSRDLRNEARRSFMLMEGGWWELFVLAHMQQAGHWTDIRWSVQFAADNSAGETDIVAFDARTVGLEVISCKAGRIQKSLEHCESLRRRATAMGGRRAQPILAVFQFPNERAEKEIRLHAQANGVAIRTLKDFNPHA